MRKFTLILSLLVAFVTTAMAQVEDLKGKKIAAIGDPATSVTVGQWYILNNVGRNNIVSEETTAMKMRATSSVAANDLAEKKAGYLFKITLAEDGEHYNIMSGNGIYFALSSNASSISETPVRYVIGNQDEEIPSVFYLYDDDNKYCADGQETDYNFVGWSSNYSTSTTGNDAYRLLPITLESASIAEVTYQFQYNGVTKYTQTTSVEVGAEYPDFNIEFPYGVSAVKPEGTISADDIEIIEGVNTITKEITLNISLPFEYADSYDNINNWYFLQFHATDKNYLYYGGSADVLDASMTTFDVDDNNYYWGFVGNPFDGYTVVNRGAGADKALNAGESGAIVGDEAQVMTLTASSHAENGFFMQNLTGSYTQRFNKQNNKVVYWSGADAGSTFMVEDSDEALATLIADFKTHATSGLGCVGGYTVDKADAINAIETYADMKAFKDANTPIAFDENKYYRIQNVYRTTFISVTGTGRVLKAEDKADVSQIWQVENGTDGAYLIKSPNAGYMQAVGSNELVAENGAEFVISSFSEGAGQFGITSKGTINMLAGINDTTLGTWWGGGIDGDMSYRFIEAEDIEISVDELASIYLPFAVEVEGATVYSIEEINSTHAILTEKADIPAYEGAILAGNGTAKLNIIDAATTEWTNNMLEGTTIDSYIEGTAYVLSKSKHGLYKAALNKSADGTEGTTHFKNNANKAYMPISSANESNFYGLRLPGSTGVENVTVENGVKTIFDLTGRKIESVTAPGIYIINGKKVLVK